MWKTKAGEEACRNEASSNGSRSWLSSASHDDLSSPGEVEVEVEVEEEEDEVEEEEEEEEERKDDDVDAA